MEETAARLYRRELRRREREMDPGVRNSLRDGAIAGRADLVMPALEVQ